MSASDVVIAVGVFLVVAGVTLTAVQLLRDVPPERVPMRSAEASAGRVKLSLTLIIHAGGSLAGGCRRRALRILILCCG